MKPLTAAALEASLLASVTYFDVLGLAITPFELWQYWISPARFGQRVAPNAAALAIVFELLDQPFLKQRLTITQGFVHLQGRAQLVETRISMMKRQAEKLKRVRSIVRRLRWLPFLKAVFISGSVAVGHPKPESDIDLLVVVKAGRIWLTRVLVDRAAFIMGRKRRGFLTRDRACLNHYITDEHLTIQFPSLYNAVTYKHLLPIWEAGREAGLLAKFYTANAWLKDFLFTPPRLKPDYRWQINSQGVSPNIRNILEYLLTGRFGNFLERSLGRWQKRRIEADPRTHRPGGRVKADHTQLEFHPDSREVDILKRYNAAMRATGINNFQPEPDSGLTK